jgi:steroid delta-isomerase-like uncharacterized protein
MDKFWWQLCVTKVKTRGIFYMSEFVKNWLTAWNDHDTDKLLGLYENDFGSTDFVSESRRVSDTGSFIHLGLQMFTAFPDLHFNVRQTVEENEKVAILWMARGTHQGRYNNIPPTGKKMQISGTSFFELKNGKITSAVFLWDGADVLRQMGLLPELQHS